jgi:hypothetical protein
MTFVEAEFAGQLRRFELVAPSNDFTPSFEDRERNLAELAARAATKRLGAEDVRHVLAFGLQRGRGLYVDPDTGKGVFALHEARALVSEAMRGRPLAEFIPLAVDIIEAAYVGRVQEEAVA